MLADSPLSMALRRRGLPAGSPPPARAATEISRITLVKILPRWASTAFLRCSIEGPRPMDATVLGKTAILRDRRQCRRHPETPFVEETGGVIGRLPREDQTTVAGLDHDVIRQPWNPGF